jgi:hypothetical protein
MYMPAGMSEVFFRLEVVQLNKKFWEELIAYFPRYDTGHIENDASNNSPIVACVLVTAVTFLPSRCLAPLGGFIPSRCLATIRGFLPSRCLAKIKGIFLPSRYIATIRGLLQRRCLATIGGDTRKSACTHGHTRTATWSHKPTLFFQNRKVG